ncbi:autotransporter assembly complex protein TamA [Noviherbaspirillum galbum]|uniref:Outer membrane protein assembly factor n=1 Tax=Noviherbaspirillum galbum TaxID=2709383 RepID=A0A6B3SKB9_9BURK|nr:autotransporter assembly complex family protein [Noviherbaspirillum galbum]NEX60998.1 outer membrane protein assembly factor [Noviherbaspirillum galbum]
MNRLLAGMIACMFATCAHARYAVELDAPRSVRKLLQENLDLMRYQDRDDLNADQLDYLLATTEEQVRKLTSTIGFFAPKTRLDVDRAGATPRIRIGVDPGKQTRVANLDIGIKGDVVSAHPEQAAEVRTRWQEERGKPFTQEGWESAKQEGLARLQSRRYAAASITNSEARAYPDLGEADLQADYDSGPAFHLGGISVSGLRRYPEGIIRNVNPLEPGEEYSAGRLVELQRQIQRLPYFSNAEVSLERDPAKAAAAPVNVRISEYPEHRVRAGFGYGTDTGAHLEGRYSYNNLFGRAWVFDSQVRIEQRRQTMAAEVSMPPSPGAWVNSARVSAERTTLEGVDLRTRRAGLRRARSSDKRDFAYTLDYYSDQLSQESGAVLPEGTVVLPGTHQAVVAGLAMTRRQVDDPRYPRRGYIASVEAGVAIKGLLTDQTFARVYGQARQYFPVGRTDAVIVRGELGAVISSQGNAAIPASLLFRTGGTESVRGYRFQSIGNTQGGVVYPTRYVASGGAEYQHWFTAQWGAAAFYDVGTATDQWSGKRFFHGVGAGARWRSPVGVINADLAYGLQEGGGIRPHLSLGIVF